MISGAKRGETLVAVMPLPKHKLPALTVQFDNDNTIYKVATFDSAEKAKWFIEVMDEFFAYHSSDSKSKTNREIFKEVFGFYPNDSVYGRGLVCIRGDDCNTYCDLQTSKHCEWWDEEYRGEI